MKPTPASFADLKARNQKIDHHWFDRDTMRFFATKLHGKPIPCARGGHCFVTSEQCRFTDPRQFSVRWATPHGAIETVGAFQAHATLADAKRAAHAFANETPGDVETAVGAP